MKTILDTYLEEIAHYLGGKRDCNEILEDIRSHITEKAEVYGKQKVEKPLEKAISEFGSPQSVATLYLDDVHIIKPSYRKFLFRYTWFLFAIHILFSIGPMFLSISSLNDAFVLLSSLLSKFVTIWIFDFGLIAFIFFCISQEANDVRVQWPSIAGFVMKPAPLRTTSIYWAGVFGVICIVSIVLVIHFGSIFHIFGTLIQPSAFEQPDFYKLLSFIAIFIFSLETITIIIQYYLKTLWVDLFNSVLYLVTGFILLNIPKSYLVADTHLHPVLTVGAITISIILFFVFWDIIRIIRTLIRNRLTSK